MITLANIDPAMIANNLCQYRISLVVGGGLGH